MVVELRCFYTIIFKSSKHLKSVVIGKNLVIWQVIAWSPSNRAVLFTAKNETFTQCWINTYNAEIYLYKPRRPKGFFNLKSSWMSYSLINSYRFIWISYLWYEYRVIFLNSFNAGTDFGCQILTYINLTSNSDPGAERVNVRPAS